VTVTVAIVGTVFAIFNWQTRKQVAEDIRQETRERLKAVVTQELEPKKIDAQIFHALQQKTDAEFKVAINSAVASELNTPERQKFFDAAIQRQIDALTRRLTQRQRIADLGDRAISGSPNNGTALAGLRNLWRNASDDATRTAARAELARVVTFWASGASYLPGGYKLKALNGKPVQDESKLTTCELLAGLRSSIRNERAQSANLLVTHREQVVLDALVRSTSDDDLNVVVPVLRSLVVIAGEYPAQGEEAMALPESKAINEWWAERRAAIVASLKLPAGPDCGK
jgi:hypothetical protein